MLFNLLMSSTKYLMGQMQQRGIIYSQKMPKSQLCIIPNTGHVVFLENFAAGWASIVPFLEIKNK